MTTKSSCSWNVPSKQMEAIMTERCEDFDLVSIVRSVEIISGRKLSVQRHWDSLTFCQKCKHHTGDYPE